LVPLVRCLLAERPLLTARFLQLVADIPIRLERRLLSGLALAAQSIRLAAVAVKERAVAVAVHRGIVSVMDSRAAIPLVGVADGRKPEVSAATLRFQPTAQHSQGAMAGLTGLAWD
jgi:hypothetical protein